MSVIEKKAMDASLTEIRWMVNENTIKGALGAIGYKGRPVGQHYTCHTAFTLLAGIVTMLKLN